MLYVSSVFIIKICFSWVFLCDQYGLNSEGEKRGFLTCHVSEIKFISRTQIQILEYSRLILLWMHCISTPICG